MSLLTANATPDFVEFAIMIDGANDNGNKFASVPVDCISLKFRIASRNMIDCSSQKNPGEGRHTNPNVTVFAGHDDGGNCAHTMVIECASVIRRKMIHTHGGLHIRWGVKNKLRKT